MAGSYLLSELPGHVGQIEELQTAQAHRGTSPLRAETDHRDGSGESANAATRHRQRRLERRTRRLVLRVRERLLEVV